MFDYEKINTNRVMELAHECTLFLKKDNNFPLSKPCKIDAFGNGVRKTLKGGTGSGEVNSHFFTTIEEELINNGFDLTTKSYLDEYDIVYKKARKKFIKKLKKDAKRAHMNAVAYGMGMIMPEMDYDLPLSYDADCCIYVLSRISGEGNDRVDSEGDFKLTKTEIEQINLLNEKYDKFMLVLNIGGPVDLKEVNNVKNILLLSQLGISTSKVLVDILLGKVNPSGKLATTYSSFEDYNKDIDFKNIDETNYFEGIYVGYRYFDSVNKKALYPFGYGLSYTDFSIDLVSYKIKNEVITLKVNVKNIGEYSGKEVVQVYLSKPTNTLDNPYQDLVAFKKTKLLNKNEVDELEISFNLCDFSIFNEETCNYFLDYGKYVVRLGNSSVNTKPILVLELDEIVNIRHVKALTTKPNFKDKIYSSDRKEDLSNIKVEKLDLSNIKLVEENYDRNVEVLDLVKELDEASLIKLCMGTFNEKAKFLTVVGNASRSVAGAAGESRKLDNVKPITMADGPAGLRLARKYYVDQKGVHSVGDNGLPESFMELLTGLKRFLFKMLVHNKKKAPKGVELKYQYATAIPIATAIAQSFNTDYAYTLGDVVGSEMELFHVMLWLAPALNIHRSVLCGRNFEYYSEDPLISGLMAKYITLGVESHTNCGVTIKHFVGNNQETNRMCNSSNLSERALREIYLKGFEIVLKDAKPKSLMSSYNLINGIHASEHYGLMHDYLRCECNYDGLIMTDWTTPGFVNPKLKYKPMDIKYVIKAGGDIFMPGCMYDFNNLTNGLRDGVVDKIDLERSASQVVRTSINLSKEKDM